MKTKLATVFLVLALAFVQKGFSQEETSVILERAYEQAKKEDKNVLVLFKASWCGWCKRMKQNINHAAVKDLFYDNYVIAELDVKESKRKKYLENPGAIELLQKYEADELGIPFALFFDAEGKLLRKNTDDKGINLGCPASEREVHFFQKNLKETSDLTAEELEKIARIFLPENK